VVPAVQPLLLLLPPLLLPPPPLLLLTIAAMVGASAAVMRRFAVRQTVTPHHQAHHGFLGRSWAHGPCREQEKDNSSDTQGAAACMLQYLMRAYIIMPNMLQGTVCLQP
jgi:hypothetical protein